MLPDCIPFPLGSSGTVDKPPTDNHFLQKFVPPIHKTHRREWSSSACHTEYDNAESEDFDEVYDVEEAEIKQREYEEAAKPHSKQMSMSMRLEELKKALIGEVHRRSNDSELEIAADSTFSLFSKNSSNKKSHENVPLLQNITDNNC